MKPLALEWPDADVRSRLHALHPDFQLEILNEADSTNTQLLSRLHQGVTTPTLLVVENQTAAKGRMGKKWQVQLGHSLTFSILTPTCLENIGWLALVSACSLVEILQKKLNMPPASQLKIKWPNDIWLKPMPDTPWHKLVGILIETATVNQQRYAVIGIGINISTCSSQNATEIPLGYLTQLGSQWDVPTAFAHIAPDIVQAVYNFKKEDIPHWKALFQRYDLLSNQPLRTSNGVTGIGLGVNSQGQFLIKTGDGIQTIHSGEVSIRPC